MHQQKVANDGREFTEGDGDLLLVGETELDFRGLGERGAGFFPAGSDIDLFRNLRTFRVLAFACHWIILSQFTRTPPRLGGASGRDCPNTITLYLQPPDSQCSFSA